MRQHLVRVLCLLSVSSFAGAQSDDVTSKPPAGFGSRDARWTQLCGDQRRGTANSAPMSVQEGVRRRNLVGLRK